MKRIIRNIFITIYSIFKFSFYKSNKILTNKSTRKNLSKIDLFINDDYVPQGICSIDDYILVTMYDYNHQLYSKVCVIKDNKIVHTTLLDNYAHVGGICYDRAHDHIWITDRSGTISCYDYKDIINKERAVAKYKKVKIPGLINISNYRAVGYITYFDNRLYMGNYNIGNKSKIISYELNQDGSIDFNSQLENKSFDFVQGIAFKKIDTKILAFISSSYGINKSSIKVVDCETKKVLYKVKMPPMLEQIAFDKKGYLLALFESNAKKYKKYHFKTSDIILYQIDNL